MSMGDAATIAAILREHFTATGREPTRLVELGVHKGETSAALLHAFPQARLVMVDEWATYSDVHRYRRSGDGCARLTQAQQDANMLAAQFAVQQFGKRAMILRMSTLDAAANLFMGQVNCDAVFQDADHTYPGVRDDISAWWPLVKPGGIFAFHDVGHKRDRPEGPWGVTRALTEFVAREKLTYQQRGSCAWVVKA
jgi:hypothetical protein